MDRTPKKAILWRLNSKHREVPFSRKKGVRILWTVVCSIIPMHVGCQFERGFSLIATAQEQHMLFIPHRNALLSQRLT